MGLILDTCILIDSERQKRSVRATLELVAARTGELDLAISVLTLAELGYGIARARNASMRQLRERFLADLRSHIPVYPVTEEIAVQMGLTDGDLEAQGITVEWADLLIGITALHHGHGVLTGNLRHFRAIPGLEVVEL